MWFGATSLVASNQNAAMRFRICPLRGRVPMTRSNALMRSVTTIKRRPSEVV